jgi:hypothetical protein
MPAYLLLLLRNPWRMCCSRTYCLHSGRPLAVSSHGEQVGAVYSYKKGEPLVLQGLTFCVGGWPVEVGQLGCAMLFLNPPTVRPGTLVTVVLGDDAFEHVPVQ